MSLATCKDNRPWVCEVHFAFDDDLNLYYRSLTSRRHSQEIGEPPVGIYFEGLAEKLDPGAEQTKALGLLKERLQVPDKVLEEVQRPDGHQVYKITVETFYIFGKLDNQGTTKYEVKWNEGIGK
jgi:hypothetical protein